MPQSRTATLTAEDDFVTSQASGALILSIPHSSAKRVSFGM